MRRGTPGIRTANRVGAPIAAIVVAGVALLILAGCGVIGQTYLWIEWSTSYFESYYPRWMDDFEKAHADQHVRIHFRAMPSDAAQKIYTMMISHTLSDVVTCGPGVAPLLLENRALEPIPDSAVDTKDFMPIALDGVRYVDGSLAAIPEDSGIRPFIYFDSADMDEVHTTAADVPVDFEGYRKWAAKFFKWSVDGKTVLGPLPQDQLARASLLRRPLGITRAHAASSYPFMLAYVDPQPGLDGKVHNSIDEFLGGPPSSKTFRFDTPEIARGLGEWQKFFYPKKDAICDGDAERLVGLQQDVYAGCEAGNWIFGEVFTVDMQVTSLPHAEGKPLKLFMSISGNGVSRESKHKALALELAQYIGATNQQVDAYYGHGYLPCRYSAWERLDKDDKQDQKIRAEFLGAYRQGQGEFICEPLIKRHNHDTMDVQVFVPLPLDITVVAAHSWEAQPEIPAPEAPQEGQEATPVADVKALAQKYSADVKALADKVAAATGDRVTVMVRGTPDEMRQIRSRVPKSPIPVYIPLLKYGVYPPNLKVWDRITSEVIARAIQFVSKDDKPMTPEEAAKWCQEEATAILSGKK